MKTKLEPILTKTNVINFMTKIGLRLEMFVSTDPVAGFYEKTNFPFTAFYWEKEFIYTNLYIGNVPSSQL